ncbi:MAG: transglutaminase-like cysteine peptidase [Kiloniellales bacterium]
MPASLPHGSRRTKRLVLAALLSLLALGWTTGLAAAEPVSRGPVTAALNAEAAMGPMHGLFGTGETRSPNLKPFKKWGGVLARYRSQRDLETRPCTGRSCALRHWRNFLDSLEGRRARYQINAVQRYVNQVRYIADRRSNRSPDHWATPAEFFGRGGDCEDFAIAKYLSLRALGFSSNAMRIVVLQDMSLGIPHAVLVVSHEGQRLVLDNQLKIVVAAEKIRHYQPYYSINENFWWRHNKPDRGSALVAQRTGGSIQ